jgi:hypothetical protein
MKKKDIDISIALCCVSSYDILASLLTQDVDILIGLYCASSFVPLASVMT